MKLRSAVLLLAFASLTLAASASKPGNKFELIHTSDGKTVGHASYTIDQTKTGYKLSSDFDATIPRSGNDAQPSSGSGGHLAPLEVQASSSYKLNPDGSFVSGGSQSDITHTVIDIKPNKDRTSITFDIRNGSDFNPQTISIADPDFFVIPDYDPGAIQVLMTSVQAHPHANNQYFLLLPVNPDFGQSNSAGKILLNPESDVSGTFDGKPVALKHYTINFSTTTDEIYTDATGTLMEAIMGPLGITCVRDHFALTPAS